MEKHFRKLAPLCRSIVGRKEPVGMMLFAAIDDDACLTVVIVDGVGSRPSCACRLTRAAILQ